MKTRFGIVLPLLLAACSVTDSSSSGDGVGPQFERRGLQKEFVPRNAEVAWQLDSSDTYRRQALVVAANKYQLEPNWVLPNALTNRRELERALVDHCGYSEDAIQTLSGEDVDAVRLEAAIKSMARKVRPNETNLLVIYYTGHGWVEGGEQQFFTYLTQREDNKFRNTVSRSDILGWVAEARAVAEQSNAQLIPVLIADACRINVGAPPGKASVRASDIWEMYGTRDGEFVIAPSERDEPFPYTGALVEILQSQSLSTEASDLSLIHRATTARTRELTRNGQVPQLLVPKGVEDPNLVVPGRIPFTLVLVDAVNGRQVESATVKLDGKKIESTDGATLIFSGEGQHQLTIRSGNHLPRTVSVNLNAGRKNRVLEVPLQPDVVEIRGTITPPQKDFRVQWMGNDLAPIRDYHVAQATSHQGHFKLLVPALEGVIEIRSGDEVHARLEVPNSPDGMTNPTNPVIAGYDGIRHVNMAWEAPDEVGGEDGLTAMPLELPELMDREKTFWTRARGSVNDRNYERALSYLDQIRTNSPAVMEWRLWLEKKWVASALNQGLSDGIEHGDWKTAMEAVAWFEDHPKERANHAEQVETIEREMIPLACRKIYRRALDAENSQEFEEALSLLAQAEEDANEHYRTEIQARTKRIRDTLFDAYLYAADQHEDNRNWDDALLSYMDAVRIDSSAVGVLRDALNRYPNARSTTVGRRAVAILKNHPLHLEEFNSDLGINFIYVDDHNGESFWVAQSEVTQAQWGQASNTSPWQEKRPVTKRSNRGKPVSASAKPGATLGDRYPVVYVDFSAAERWCRSANRKCKNLPKGFEFKLPTVEQWRIACLAGSTGRFHFGKDASDLERFGYFAKNSRNDHPEMVMKLTPNDWSLYDMHGNVSEWCLDGGGQAGQHSTMGGSYMDPGSSCGADEPWPQPTSAEESFIGFRPVLVRK